MPLSYTVNQEHHFIKIVGTGTLAVDEYVELNQTITDDPDCTDINRRLYDMKLVEVADTFARQSSLNDKTRGSSGEKLAILVASPAAYGMARIYQSLADQVSVQIFYDEPKALGWLLDEWD